MHSEIQTFASSLSKNICGFPCDYIYIWGKYCAGESGVSTNGLGFCGSLCYWPANLILANPDFL